MAALVWGGSSLAGGLGWRLVAGGDAQQCSQPADNTPGSTNKQATQKKKQKKLPEDMLVWPLYPFTGESGPEREHEMHWQNPPNWIGACKRQERIASMKCCEAGTEGRGMCAHTQACALSRACLLPKCLAQVPILLHSAKRHSAAPSAVGKNEQQKTEASVRCVH